MRRRKRRRKKTRRRRQRRRGKMRRRGSTRRRKRKENHNWLPVQSQKGIYFLIKHLRPSGFIHVDKNISRIWQSAYCPRLGCLKGAV